MVADASWVPVRLACQVTGLPESFFRRQALIRCVWSNGREYRLEAHGMEINIDAFQRWAERGDEATAATTLPPAAPDAQRRRRAPSPGVTRLYRHFDAAGQLLYVGISLGVMHRLQQHLGSSSWAGAIARVEVESFDTRAEAASAERDAIRAERPLHNIVHATKP